MISFVSIRAHRVDDGSAGGSGKFNSVGVGLEIQDTCSLIDISRDFHGVVGGGLQKCVCIEGLNIIKIGSTIHRNDFTIYIV